MNKRFLKSNLPWERLRTEVSGGASPLPRRNATQRWIILCRGLSGPFFCALRLTWFILWNWSVVFERILVALSSSSWAKLGKSNQFNSHRDQRKPKFYVLCLLGLHHILKTMRFETGSLLDHRLRQSMWKCCHNVLYHSVCYVIAQWVWNESRKNYYHLPDLLKWGGSFCVATGLYFFCTLTPLSTTI